jgi:hypothetical protein
MPRRPVSTGRPAGPCGFAFGTPIEATESPTGTTKRFAPAVRLDFRRRRQIDADLVPIECVARVT